MGDAYAELRRDGQRAHEARHLRQADRAAYGVRAVPHHAERDERDEQLLLLPAGLAHRPGGLLELVQTVLLFVERDVASFHTAET